MILKDVTLLYFFSTIPQVLAGVIALLGAMIIFYIQKNNDKLRGFGDHILSEIKLDDSYKDSNLTKEQKRVLQVIEIRITKAISRVNLDDIDNGIKQFSDFVHTGSYKNFLLKFQEARNQRKTVIESFKSVVLFSVLTIGLSVVALFFTDFIYKNMVLIVVTTSLNVILLATILIKVTNLLYKSVKDDG